MTKVEMMREALRELGEATPECLSAFMQSKYGVKVEPKFIPILRASVREKELQDIFRARATTAPGQGIPPQAI